VHEAYYSLKLFKNFSVIRLFYLVPIVLSAILLGVLSFFLSLFFSSTAIAAPQFLADQYSERTSLTPYLDLLEDTAGLLSIKEVTASTHTYRFAPVDRPHLNFRFTDSAYWLRFTAANTGESTLYQAFEVSPATVDSIDFYRLDRNTRGEAIISDKRPDAEYYTESPTKIYRLKLEPNSQTVFYLRVQSTGPLNLTLFASPTDRFVNFLTTKSHLMGLSIGALLLVAVINLLFSVILKQPLFLYHFAYLAAMITFKQIDNGLLVRYLPPGSSWMHQSMPLATFLMNAMAILFAYQVYKNWSLPKPCRLVLQTLIALNLAGCLSVSSLSNSFLYLWSYLLFALSLLTVIAFSLYLYVHANSRFNLQLALAKSCVVFSILGGWYCIHTGILSQNQATILVTLGLVIDAVIVSLALQFLTQRQTTKENDYQHHIALAEAECRARDKILDRINHDIRTPVSGIMGMAELLKGTALSANQKDHVETLEKSSQELLDYIHEIQDFSKLQSGDLHLQNTRFDLTALVSNCLNGFRAQAETQHIELICDIQPDTPAWVLGDAGRVRQVLLHLLRNAINHTEQGEVILRLEPEGPTIQFTVSDSGSGISKKQMKELMATDHRDYNLKEGNYSLGFQIVKQLVSAMSGKLGIISEFGQGTTVWFSIPLPEQAPHKQEAKATDRSLQGRRLLIVDDNEACRKVIVQQANGWGMRTAAAHSGGEALALLRAQANIGSQFDIVIIDQGMPTMSGLQLACRIQQDPDLDSENMVLIMLTGLSGAPDPATISETGIVRVLSKPVSGKTLRVVLTEELNYLEQSDTRVKTQEVPSNKPQQYPARVLIAEDNRISVKVLEAMLDKLGASSYTAGNGQHAFEAAQMGRYDLILMDCEMPIMDGFEATRCIRQWEHDTHRNPTPIIALTAHTMDEHKEQSQLAGMNAHLAKPINMGELENVLRRWATS